jgi:predicted nucleotide-binding protein
MTAVSAYRRLLAIDDQLGELKYYLLFLRQSGFEVTSVSTPAAALDHVRREDFDLILLDIMMPPDKSLPEMESATMMDAGVHLAVAIRNIRRDSKILVFTNYLVEEAREWFGRDPNSTVLLKKDTDPERLKDVAESIIANRKPKPRVFVVHGRDRATVLELKNFLQNGLGFPEPVILAERRSGGATIMEKFEQYSHRIDVAFVLFTPDDLGQLADLKAMPQSRPRQNVVFELGYFLGKLGRQSGRVIILHVGPLEMASDLSGLVYIDISNGIERAAEEIRRELEEWL